MSAEEWIAAARQAGALIFVTYIEGRRRLYTPNGWPGLPDLPQALGKEVADLLEAEGEIRQSAA